jgi:hypothetical protein
MKNKEILPRLRPKKRMNEKKRAAATRKENKKLRP